MLAIKIFIAGLIILVGAVLANFLAGLLGVTSWYDFLKKPKSAGFLDYLWLFIVYPLLLGLLAYLASLLFNK